MQKGIRRFAAATAALLMTLPLLAVFNEKNLGETLAVLRYELNQQYQEMSLSQEKLSTRNETQHLEMVGMLKRINELSLILYSQSQDYTFDMTYALKEVTRQYEQFNKEKMPFDRIVGKLDVEIERYSRLVEALRRIPPQVKELEDLPDSLAYHNDSVNFEIPDDLAREVIKASGRFAKDENGDFLFTLNAAGKADRDSCIFYAKSLLKMYSDFKDRIIEDNAHYEDASLRLKEGYDYAQDKYKALQRRIFVEGQDNYFYVLAHLVPYIRQTFGEAADKYAGNIIIDEDGALRKSEWRGPMVLGFIGLVLVYILIATLLSVLIVRLLSRKLAKLRAESFRKSIPCLTLFCGSVIFALSVMVASRFINNNFFALASEHYLIFAWLLAAILASLLIRLRGDQVRAGLRIYAPVVVMGLIVITFRVIFIPNRLANLILPPMLILFALWQLRVCRKLKEALPGSDMVIGWITFAVMLIASCMAVVGYVLMSVQVLIWWLFQISAIETIMALYKLLNYYEKRKLDGKLKAARAKAPSAPNGGRGTYINVTWLFDFLEMAVIPVVAILSVPVCLWMAADVFDLTAVCRTIFFKPFVDLYDTSGNEILHLSMYKIVLVSSIFFIFRYIAYLVKSVYYRFKIDAEQRKSGGRHIHTNQINFTLANNVIGIIIWGIYVIMAIFLLRIPMGAISIVAAGLATGIGLALKDVLNNFIYGIQLMSGRLRVGDYIECDGIRGKVSAISYQSTQIEALDGAVISFLNTSLFNKNFKNLTRNHSYEFVKVGVGIPYGSDVERIREILLEAMRTLQVKDRFGRDIVDVSQGVSVVLDSFGNDCLNIVIKQYVLVAERNAYIANANEAIYNAFRANNVDIPFPQLEVRILGE